MPTKTKQTFDVKTVDTPSDLVTTNQSQLFDYSQLDNAEIIKEDIQVIKQNIEDISTKILDTGRRLTRLKDNLPHGQFLPTLEREFSMSEDTAQEFMRTHNTFSNTEHARYLEGMSRRAIKVITSAINNKKFDEVIKEQILDEVKEKTEEKGEALKEKEIKEITKPYLEQIEQLKKEKEQLSLTLENTEVRIDNVKSYMESQIESKERELSKAKETLENQTKDIQEKNSKLSQLEVKERELKEREEKLNKIIEVKVKEEVEEKTEKELEKLDKQKKELEKEKAQISKELKDVQSLKRTAQRQKDNLDSTQEWITNFQLTNEFLAEVTNELKKYKKHLQKNPDLSELDEVDRLKVEEKIKNLIVDFNDNLHNLGGAINYLNGAVVKFNNHALRVLDVEGEVTENE